MKLDHLKRTVDTAGIGATSSFRLSDDPRAVQKLMDLLSNTLYSNKIGSMVRELACNAYDAHIAAGRKDVPIFIHLPDTIEPWFTIQDFGTGLSPEDVENIYQVYGASTKDDSNDMVGAFGLGSKTPLAYTDAFTVTSIFEGMQYVYSVFIDDTNTPTCSLIASMETTEHNGMTIQVPVQRSDYHRFRDEVFSQLRYFDMPINLGNTTDTFTPRDYADIIPSENFSIFSYKKTHGDTDYYSDCTINVVQGPVGYPVQASTLTREFAKFEEPDTMHNFSMVRSAINIFRMMGAEVDIFCNIGDIQVVPSRESISLSPFTVRNLFNKMVLVAEDILAHFATLAQKVPDLTEWEKACYKKDLDFAGYLAYHFGSDIVETVAPDYSQQRKAIIDEYADGVELLDCQASSYTWSCNEPIKLATSPDPFKIYPKVTNYVFFWMDVEPQPRLMTRLREYIDKNLYSSRGIRVIVFRGVEGEDYLQKKLPGAPALIKLSSVPETDHYLDLKAERAARGMGVRSASVFGYQFDSAIDLLSAADDSKPREEFNATPFMTRTELKELMATPGKKVVAIPYNGTKATVDNHTIAVGQGRQYCSQVARDARRLLHVMENNFSAEFDESEYIFVGMSETAYEKAENLYSLADLLADVKEYAFVNIPANVVKTVVMAEQSEKHLTCRSWFSGNYAETLARVCPQVKWVMDRISETQNLKLSHMTYTERYAICQVINEFCTEDLTTADLGTEMALLVERANAVHENHKGLYPIIDELESYGVLDRYVPYKGYLTLDQESDPEYFQLRYANAVKVLGFDPIQEATDAEEAANENNAANDAEAVEENDCALAA